MAKLSLKGFDFKAFFIDHGEKIGFVVFALVTLVALARTTWLRYPKTPEEIIQKVNEASQKVKASTWPEDRRAAFVLQDFMQNTRDVRGPLASAKYEYSTPLWHPLYKKQELAKEAEYLAVTDLVATYGQFTLGLMPKPTAGALASAEPSSEGSSAAGTKTAVAAAGPDDEFAPAKPAAGVPGAAGGSSLYEGGVMPPAGGASLSHAGGEAPAGAGLYQGGMMEEGSGGAYAASSMESRGERFIAVRGIFPLQQQLEKLQRALNLSSRAEARMHFELLDFVLERQAAVAGPDPWAGPWETVDISRAYEVLEEAFNYDFDTFDQSLIDPVITMPLPARLRGKWGELATHPKITRFELTGPELERMRALEEKLIEEFDKMRLEEEARTKRRGGFAKNARNLSAMANMIYSSAETASGFEESFRGDPTFTSTVRMTPQQIRERLQSPADRLLLFRYFDFDVRPGFAYRYRVKLVLRNPNENRRVEEVVEPSVAQGATRETPWSKESNVAVVPESVNYFLRVVDRDPVNEQRKGGKKAIANFSFFEWDASKGTMITDLVQVYSFGQFVGEKRKSLRLDVAKPYFKDEEVEFRSDDLFLDAEGDVKLALEDHADLKFPSKEIKGHLGLASAAVVVDRTGELVAIDPDSQAQQKAELENRVQRERSYYEDIKNKEDKPVAEGAGMLFGESSASELYGMPEGAQPKGKSKSKKKASLKPRTSGSSAYMQP